MRQFLSASVIACGAFMLQIAPAAMAQDSSAPNAPNAVSANDAAAEMENTLYLDLSTGGRVVIRMFPNVAPKHVERIKTLTRQGFYNGVKFHRVIEGFMAQTGDPTGTGQGGSDLPDLEAEFTRTPHLRGTVSMARTNEPNSANSQFFIVLQPTFALDNKYSVFGRVTSGMQHVDAIAKGEPPAQPDRIVQASIAADGKGEPDYSAAAAPQILAPAEPRISVDDL